MFLRLILIAIIKWAKLLPIFPINSFSIFFFIRLRMNWWMAKAMVVAALMRVLLAKIRSLTAVTTVLKCF